jgi:hypothetical protein
MILVILISVSACQSIPRLSPGEKQARDNRILTYVGFPQMKEKLTRQIGRFIKETEIREFYVQEAWAAGVPGFRAMKPDEKRINPYFGVFNCGFAHSLALLIDADRPKCLKLNLYAHEIAHFGGGCAGHGDKFWSYHLGIAERFEAQFPLRGWNFRVPTLYVLEGSRVYRTPEECPQDRK